MHTDRKLIFNHIPKTGGLTLRSILNRVYGAENVFLVKSTRIQESLDEYRELSARERDQFSVLAGHGAGGTSQFTGPGTGTEKIPGFPGCRKVRLTS